MPAPIAAASPTRNVDQVLWVAKRRGEQRRQGGDGAVHQAGQAGLDILQHEQALGGLVLGRARFRRNPVAELLRQLFVLVLFSGELGQQLAHRGVFRRLRGAAIKPRRLELHLLGEFTRGIDRQRAVEPDRPALDKAFDVLAADQRQKIAEFLAVEIEQHVVMADLLLRHLVVHCRRVGIGFAQRVGEGTIDAVIFVFVGDGERQHFLLAQFGKAFHGLSSCFRSARRPQAGSNYIRMFLILCPAWIWP